MSKFSAAFDDATNTQFTDSEDRPKIDYAKQNAEREAIFGTKDKAKARVGIISGIIDLGVQPMEPGHKKSEVVDEEAYLLEHPTSWFADVKNQQTKAVERHVFWLNKPQRAVAVTVDFPQYTYDWGGDIGVKPFRFLLNGEFIPKGGKRKDLVVGKVYDLKETTKDFEEAKLWSLSTKSVLYKIAVATEVIKSGEPLQASQIGSLIGKAALFEVRAWINNKYWDEKITFKSEVPEGVTVPEIDEDLLFYINLNKDNDPKAVITLRQAVVNTIKRSESWETSKLKEQFGDKRPFTWQTTTQQSSVSSTPEPEVQEEKEPEYFDDDIPF